MNAIRNILSQDAHWLINKAIAKKVGLTAALLLSDLISKRDYFLKRGELEADGSFFNTANNLEHDLGLTDYGRRDAQKALIDNGYITVEKRGMPPRNYFTVNDDVILESLSAPVQVELQPINELTVNASLGRPSTDPPICINKNKDNKEPELSSGTPELIGSSIAKYVGDRSIEVNDRQTKLPSEMSDEVMALWNSTSADDRPKVLSQVKGAIRAKLANPKLAWLVEMGENHLDKIWSALNAKAKLDQLARDKEEERRAVAVDTRTIAAQITSWLGTKEDQDAFIDKIYLSSRGKTLSQGLLEDVYAEFIANKPRRFMEEFSPTQVPATPYTFKEVLAALAQRLEDPKDSE